MNNNEPILHFGDDPEESNINQSSEQPIGTHIQFNMPEQEPVQKPQEQPVKPVTPQSTVNTQQSAPQPKPVVPNPVSVQAQTTATQQPTSNTQPSSVVTKPEKIQNPNDMFGKKNLSIVLIVVNGAGVMLPQFRVDNTVVKSGQDITFSESREVYELTVGADGYKDRRIQITQTDLQKGERRVMLASQLQSLVVSFNTQDGIKRGTVDIDQTNAIYEYMKEASHTDTPLNELKIGGIGGGNAPSPKISIVPYIIALVVGIVIGAGVMSLFTCGGNDKDKTEVVADAEGSAENVEIKDEEVKPTEGDKETLDVSQTEEETASKEEDKAEENKENVEEEKKEEPAPTSSIDDRDIKYLKEKDTWSRGEAASDEVKKMLAAFCNGDIAYLTSANAYNSLDESKRNGYYNKVLKDLQKIKTQKNVERAKSDIREACKDGKVNLQKVLNRTHPLLLK